MSERFVVSRGKRTNKILQRLEDADAFRNDELEILSRKKQAWSFLSVPGKQTEAGARRTMTLPKL